MSIFKIKFKWHYVISFDIDIINIFVIVKNSFIITLIIILASCSNIQNQNKSSDLIETNFKEVNIEFLDREILIPENYFLISPEILENKLKELNTESKLLKHIEYSIEKLKGLPYEFVLYADNDNLNNLILIQSSDYIPLNERVSNLYFEMLDNQIKSESLKAQIKSTKIETQFITTASANVIKAKYLQEVDGVKKYMTQYIVTSERKTFGIVAGNFENIDIDEIINEI